MEKDVNAMTGEEIKAEIIRMVNEIDDEELLEKIYNFVLQIFKMEQNEN